MGFTQREAAQFDRYITDTPEQHDRFAYDPADMENTIEKHHYDDPLFTLEDDPYAEERERVTYPLSHQEAGRLGGLATFRKYGREHMRLIARRGGEAYNRKYVAGGKGGSIE